MFINIGINSEIVAERRKGNRKWFSERQNLVPKSRNCNDVSKMDEQRNAKITNQTKGSSISLMDLVILQFLYTFRNVYDVVKSILNRSYWQNESPPLKETEQPVNEKRHFIQLYKTEPQEEGEKPICYMNVIEFDNWHDEEEIRKRKHSLDVPRAESLARYKHRHQRAKSDHDLPKFCYSNLRY